MTKEQIIQKVETASEIHEKLKAYPLDERGIIEMFDFDIC